MTRRINDREWQELSAYLDGELTAKESVRLEQKMKQHPELRAAYQDLRQVRHLLRSQPRLRSPRNFTLTPQTAGIPAARRSAPRRFPVFGLVSALASIMLVLVIAGEFLVGSPGMTAQPVAMEAQFEAASTEELPMLQADAESSSKVLPTPLPPEAGLRAYPAPESEENSAMAPQALESSPMEYPPPEQPAEALSMTAEESVNAETDVSQEQPPASSGFWNGWRIAQITLLFIALGSAAAAIYFKQKRNL